MLNDYWDWDLEWSPRLRSQALEHVERSRTSRQTIDSNRSRLVSDKTLMQWPDDAYLKEPNLRELQTLVQAIKRPKRFHSRVSKFLTNIKDDLLKSKEILDKEITNVAAELKQQRLATQINFWRSRYRYSHLSPSSFTRRDPKSSVRLGRIRIRIRARLPLQTHKRNNH